MMGCSPRCYIPSFVEISPPVQEKRIFEGFLPYMGVAAHLVTSIMLINFHFLVPESFHTKFGSCYVPGVTRKELGNQIMTNYYSQESQQQALLTFNNLL